MKKQIDLTGSLLALFLIAVLMAVILFSCSTTKDKSKTRESATEVLLREKEDSIRLLKNELSTLYQQIEELIYAGVYFDSSRCPPTTVIIDENCNADSIRNILDQYKDRVKFFADGTVEIQGRLSKVLYTKERMERTMATMQRTIDSLSQVKQKENVVKEYYKVTETKYKKTGLQWWLLIIGAAICYLVLLGINKWKEKSLSIHK